MEECQGLRCKRLVLTSVVYEDQVLTCLGDGVTDDTAAINRAISDGGRCGADCGSSTIVPAVVWFPGGTYLVSTSIIQFYNTQFIGDVSITHLEFITNGN